MNKKYYNMNEHRIVVNLHQVNNNNNNNNNTSFVDITKKILIN